MGSGGGGNTTTSQEFKPPANTQAGWDQYMQTAMGLSGMPFQDSGIPSVAPWNDYQQGASQAIYDRAMNGDPSSNAGRGAITGIAAGNHSNPWQTMLAGTAMGQNQNPFMSGAAAMAQGGNNPFMAGMQSMANGQDNPYIIDPQKFIDAQAADMTRAAQKGTMAQTDSAANRAGAYGGSAYQEMQSENAKNLADSIGTMSANTRMQANNANAQMWQNAQQNRLNAMGLGNSAYLGGQGNQLQALGLGGNMFSTGLGQQLQAAMGGGSMFNQDIGNMLSAAGLAPAYANMDQNDFAALMNAGNAMNGYQQNLLNAGNSSFQQQMMYPFFMNEQLGGALTRASGQGGTSVNTQPGSNNVMNGIGLGLMGYGMFGGH